MSRTTNAIMGTLLVVLLAGAPAVSAADEMAATETAVTIPATDHDIVGTLALPADADGPVPAVLMLHGYGSSADEVGDMYGRLAEALAAQGVGSLRIDFAGMGASPASTLDYTYDSMTSDATTALDWLGRPGVRRSGARRRPGLQPRVAHRRAPRGHRPATHRLRLLVRRHRTTVTRPSMTRRPTECEATGEGHIVVDLGFRTLDHSCEYFSSMATSTALADFAPYAGALLLVAGSDDTTVDPSVSENAATASASEDVTLEIIEGADHIYHVLTEDQTLADQAIDLTADWFAEKL